MYVPEHFKPDDASVRELLLNHGAVDLITATPTGLRATMLPMIYVEPADSSADASLGLLLGHFARKNDHWQQPVVGEALAIVRGPDSYITPTGTRQSESMVASSRHGTTSPRMCAGSW